ncbi:LOW QUALITY PROTEIN: hypothetical protein M8C21_007291, partial [Ambrosia artemisiifolia]
FQKELSLGVVFALCSTVENRSSAIDLIDYHYRQWNCLNCGQYSDQASPAPCLEPGGGFGWTPSSVQVSFLHYLPGIFASLAALMFNCVRREDIDYSPYEEGEWRLKLWLFLAYVVSFVSLAASVGLLIQDSLVPEGPSAWTGTAGVLQCVLVLISGLVYWTSHSE